MRHYSRGLVTVVGPIATAISGTILRVAWNCPLSPCVAASYSAGRRWMDRRNVTIASIRITERGATRADDRTSEAAMEDRKKEGYF